MIKLGKQEVSGLPRAAQHQEAAETHFGEDIVRDNAPMKPPGGSVPWQYREADANRNMNPDKSPGIARPKEQQGGNPS